MEDMRNACRSLIWKYEVKRPLERPRHRWKVLKKWGRRAWSGSI
jgi:hypothetical protein